MVVVLSDVDADTLLYCQFKQDQVLGPRARDISNVNYFVIMHTSNWVDRSR